MANSKYNGLKYFNNQAPSQTAGKAVGTKYFTICQQTFFLKKTNLEAELVNVPMDIAAGTWTIGNIRPRIGISIRPAPPPQMALIENAIKLTINMIINNIVIIL